MTHVFVNEVSLRALALLEKMLELLQYHRHVVLREGGEEFCLEQACYALLIESRCFPCTYRVGTIYVAHVGDVKILAGSMSCDVLYKERSGAVLTSQAQLSMSAMTSSSSLPFPPRPEQHGGRVVCGM